tara:strand:+ start:27093 stop:27446 length:354 start_codon:yes stop_codon:yes gene_type:complete
MDKTPIIRSSQQFNKLLINLFFSSKNIISCSVSTVIEREDTVCNDRVDKVSYLYEATFWRGAFNRNPIIVKYKHFRYLSGRAVTNIVLSEVLDRTGEYHLDNTPNGCKIYKERIVEG